MLYCEFVSTFSGIEHECPLQLYYSSHDLPWLSKPLVPLIYTATQPTQTQGIHPTLSQTSCNTRVTLNIQHNAHPALGKLSPSHDICVTLMSPP